jgi:hypothetical protein
MAIENCPFEVTPYDKSSLIKTPNLINLNYTNQDFWSMKSRLIDLIRQRFSETFNDFVESDLAIMLIENWAFIADTLSFKIDQIANEIFIDTVSQVDNAFRLALLVGFKPQPPVGSRSLWSATINNLLDTDIFIDTPVSIDINTEEGPKVIELYAADTNNNPLYNESIVISSGSFLNTSIVGLEGTTYTQTAQGTGESNQSIRMIQGPVIWNSVRVRVDGVEWQQVDYFTDSQPRREFRVEYDPAYNGFVVFGNNRAGLIPTLGSDIQIIFRAGGGYSGNIVTGSVELQRNFEVGGFDFRVPVTFRNYTKGEFGHPGDTIEDIKRKMPAWIRLQNRCVSGDDIEAFTNQFVTEFNGRVGKAKAVLRNYGCAANIIDLYVLSLQGADGLMESENAMKLELQAAMEDKKMLTDHICIKNGGIVEVDVHADLTLDKFYRKFEDEFREKVNRRVNSFFSLNNWDYGKILKNVDLIKSMSDIAEIRNIEIHFQTNNPENSGEVVTTKYYEIIRPSIVDINFIYE